MQKELISMDKSNKENSNIFTLIQKRGQKRSGNEQEINSIDPKVIDKQKRPQTQQEEFL